MKQLYLKEMILTVLMGMVGTKALAYEVEVDGIYYDLNNTDYTASVSSYDYNYFYGENLENITVPGSIISAGNTYTVTTIGSNAFNGCGFRVVLPNSVTRIENEAFCYYRCDDTSITLPDNLEFIGYYAFRGSGLTSIKIPDKVKVIEDAAFGETPLVSVTIPKSVTSIEGNPFEGCRELSSIIVEEGNPNYDSREGCNAIIETATNKLQVGCKTSTVPNSVTIIGVVSFECLGDLSITLHSGVEEIERDAFAANYFVSITFDNCVPTLGDDLFAGVSPSSVYIYYPAYAYEYFTTNEQTGICSLHPQIKIDREWTTYCATASFDVPDDIEAYVVKSYNDGVVTLKKVTTINEGQGVLLKPAAVGTAYDATLCASTPDAYDSNLLKGVTAATDITATDGEYTNFVFTKVGDEIGFYPANAGTIPAYKAYLQIPTASLPSKAPARLSIVFEGGETTSIESVRSNPVTENDWYTLQGQRVVKPTKQGVYINNGKKVVIK